MVRLAVLFLEAGDGGADVAAGERRVLVDRPGKEAFSERAEGNEADAQLFQDREDIGLTYRLQVSCFVVLPKDRELRQRKIEACLEFWSKYALLPELRRWWGEA